MKGFRTLYAKTRTKKKKQRVSAAASGGDFAVEEPNLGVARALVVILILHVAAIVAIVVHSSRSDDRNVATREPAPDPATTSRATAQAQSASKPKIGANDQVEYVQQGDTYERFARRYGVDVQELRRANGNTPLLYGMPLIMPQQPTAQPAMAQLPPVQNEVLPPIVYNTPPQPVQTAEAARNLANFEEVVTLPAAPTPNPYPASPQVSPTPQPVVEVRRVAAVEPIRVIEPEPVIIPQNVVQEQIKPAVVEAPKPVAKPKPKTKSYTVRKGDTLWAIANRNGISIDKLMAANKGLNPRTLSPGRTKVNIPIR